MARQRSIRITDELDRFIEERVGNEDYRSADDVVEAGLRLLRKNAEDVDEVAAWFAAQDVRPITTDDIRAALRAGDESGPAEPIDFHQLSAEIETELENERAERR